MAKTDTSHLAYLNGLHPSVICRADDDLGARCLIADSGASFGQWFASLKHEDFNLRNNVNPLTNEASRGWIGGQHLPTGATQHDYASSLGHFVKSDIDKIQQTASRVSDAIDSLDLDAFVRKLVWSPSLGKVNALRILNGCERYSRARRRTKAPTDAVALCIPMCVSAGVPADALMARAAVALAAADILMDYGFAVEVWAYAYSTNIFNSSGGNKHRDALAAVRLKASDEPLNEALAASGASAWFYRTGLFAAWEVMSNNDESGGLGQAIALDNRKAENVARVMGLQQAHIMRGGNPFSVESAIDATLKDLKQALETWTEGAV